jgi:hypothetical protein
VSITAGARPVAYRARSSARWLVVKRRGRAPGTLIWHVSPKRLHRGTYHGTIAIRARGLATARLTVTYAVGPRAKIVVSPGALTFSERAIDGSGHPATPQCGATVWNDELKRVINGSADTTGVDPSTRTVLRIGNGGSRRSVLHYEVLYTTETGAWLGQDLNPGNNAAGFQTAPQQPLVSTVGAVRGHRSPAVVPLASTGDTNQVGGYPPMSQGTYTGVVQIRDLADPRAIKSVPAALALGDGKGTPTIAAAPTAFTETLAPGASTTIDLALSDASRVCGYAYSLSIDQPWATVADGLYSGTVAVPAATSAPAATDTGGGNGYTPIALSAAGLARGTHHATITVQSQNAQGNATRIPITLTVT